MALKRPPQHRVDAKPIFVHNSDDAWKNERIDQEIEKLEAKEKGLGDTHPVMIYRSGETRYDLSLVLPFLDTDKAWQFELRPLSMEDFAEVRDMIDRFGTWRGYLRAAEIGLLKISGHNAPSDLSECSEIDVLLPNAVGQAVFVASLPLTEPEKKASGS